VSRTLVAVPGDYQHRAATQGPAVQRFWHFAKRLAIARYLPPGAGELVLDVGCGSGVVSGYLGDSGARVVGIDPHGPAIAYAATAFARSNVTFVNTTIDRVRLERAADKIYCLEVIEHLSKDEADELLKAFHRMLRSDGRVLVTTPNLHSAWPVIEWAVDVAGRAPRMRGAQHVEMYHARRLRALAERNGFTVRSIRSMCLLAPWVAGISWRLAIRLFAVEARLPGRPGPILVAVLERNERA
jgi:2-polyprenyl-3-methyl-5-hydroxy-6-metoxy-1,4-benzoquinol methylase